MIEVTQIIDDVKGDFEGGNSLSVDWNILVRRGMENVLDNLRPETLKRTVPIYGGVSSDLTAYYSPSDVLVPSDLYKNDNSRYFKYGPTKVFFKNLDSATYTLEYVNGSRFIFLTNEDETTSVILDEMNSVGSKTGGSPKLNTQNFLYGTGSIQATFSSLGTEFGSNITPINITTYLNGISLLPTYISDVTQLASLEVRLKTDDLNYYRVISTSDSVGDYIVNGWNMIRFDLANATLVGSPNPANITEWSVIGTSKTGNINILFDRFTLQDTNPYYLEYYSNKSFKDGVSGAWKDTVSLANNDIVNIDRDVSGILHFEICLLVTQSATFDRVDSQATTRFTEQLKRKYQSYWSSHPSSETPVSYSISPDIPKESNWNTD